MTTETATESRQVRRQRDRQDAKGWNKARKELKQEGRKMQKRKAERKAREAAAKEDAQRRFDSMRVHGKMPYQTVTGGFSYRPSIWDLKADFMVHDEIDMGPDYRHITAIEVEAHMAELVAQVMRDFHFTSIGYYDPEIGRMKAEAERSEALRVQRLTAEEEARWEAAWSPEDTAPAGWMPPPAAQA